MLCVFFVSREGWVGENSHIPSALKKKELIIQCDRVRFFMLTHVSFSGSCASFIFLISLRL